MGWLGRLWEEVRREDVNGLLLALEGRENLLQMIFGDGSSRGSTRQPITADRWRSFAQAHNRRYAAKGRTGRRGS